LNLLLFDNYSIHLHNSATKQTVTIYNLCIMTGYTSNWSLNEQTGSISTKRWKSLSPTVDQSRMGYGLVSRPILDYE